MRNGGMAKPPFADDSLRAECRMKSRMKDTTSILYGKRVMS